MSFKTVIRFCCISILSALIFCGCGREDPGKGASPGSGQEISRVYDPASGKWLGFGDVEASDPSWSAVGYADELFLSPGPEYQTIERCYAQDQDHFYGLYRYISELDGESKSACRLHSIDTRTLQTDSKDLTLTDGKLFSFDPEKETLYPVSLDVSGEELCAFLKVWDAEAQLYTHFYALWMTREGSMENAVDLLPAIRGRSEEKNDDFFPSAAALDEKGGYCLIDAAGGEILTVDRQGEGTGGISFPDYEEMSLAVSFKSAEGIPVLEYRKKDGQAVFFTVGDAEEKVLYAGEVPAFADSAADENGNLYFLSGKRLLRWNVADGVCSSLCDTDGIREGECVGLLKNSMGEIAILCGKRGTPYLYKLSDSQDEAGKELVLLQLRQDEYTKSCAEEYSRTHPGIRIRVETPEDTGDEAFARLLEELKNGDGPDLIVTDRRRMELLARAKVLTALDLPESLRQQVFGGVLSYGVIDGIPYGIPHEASLHTLLVSNRFWGQEGWTARDLMKIMRENASLKQCFAGSYPVTADALFYEIFARNPDGSPFLDTAAGECDFENEDFLSLLRFCREYGDAPESGRSLTEEELYEQMQKGETLCVRVEGGLKEFSRVRAMYDGEAFRCVGVPDESGNGNLVCCHSCVVISKNTAYPDIAEDFYEYMLSEKCQTAYTVNWVRRDVMTEHVREHTEFSQVPVFLLGEGAYMPLEGDSEGNSFLEEYLSLMEHEKMECTEYEIIDMLMEETGMYFAGDGDETTVADVLQSRISLYLWE